VRIAVDSARDRRPDSSGRSRGSGAPAGGAGAGIHARPPSDLLALQRLASGDRQTPGALGDAETHEAAQRGTSGASGPLPFLEVIQRSFGKHDVSDVSAHTDGAAASAARAIDATAFTTGRHVAFANRPSLRTAAHEAAHVIQQRGGVQLEGGVGAAGDRYERHADAVADQVVQGHSAEALLDAHAGERGGPTVQRETPSATPKDDKAPAAPAPAPVPTQLAFKDILLYPLFRDIFKDLACKEITPAERKLLALKGTEGAAFYAWTMAAGLAPSTIGGGTRPKDFFEYAGAVSDYADALTGLTPANSAIFDPLSRLIGLRVDDYLASDRFKTRLFKEHPLSIPAVLVLAQGAWSLGSALKDKNTDPTTLESDDLAQHLKLLQKAVGGIFKEQMKAPTFFDMGPLQLATHPIFAYAPFAGGPAPSGLSFDRNVDTAGVLRETKYGGTVNLPKLLGPGGATPEEIGDPARYRGWQGSAWFNYEEKNPLTLGTYSQPFARAKGGTIFGYGGHLGELEAGATYSGGEARALTSFFVRGGYGYTAGEKDQQGIEKHGLAAGRKIGFTATFLDWKATDILAPRDPAGVPTAGWALKATPFLGLRVDAGHKVTVDASAAVSFVLGQTRGQLTSGISDVAGTLAITYLGNAAPGQLPAFKIDLTGSLGRLDWHDESSPLLYGLQAKANVDRMFAGVQVNTGAGSISPERKDAIDPKTKVMVPTAVLFTGGVAF
jgi:uncharacterized protein DUF4157